MGVSTTRSLPKNSSLPLLFPQTSTRPRSPNSRKLLCTETAGETAGETRSAGGSAGETAAEIALAFLARPLCRNVLGIFVV